MKGSYIVIEGGEHVGKSTQVERIAALLPALAVREPGGTPIGETLRDIIKDPDVEKQPLTQALILAAQRHELVETIIRPEIETGGHVISDRSWLSGLAYQAADGVTAQEMGVLRDLSLGDLQPDVYFLLDADPQTVAPRVPDGGVDYYESRGDEFHQELRQRYLDAGQAIGAVVIDATQATEAVTEQIMGELVTRGHASS